MIVGKRSGRDSRGAAFQAIQVLPLILLLKLRSADAPP